LWINSTSSTRNATLLMENLFYQPNISNGSLFLDEDESRHCAKVLRKRPGDLIQVTDGNGVFYSVKLVAVDSHRCTFSVQSKVFNPKPNFHIHLAISPTKNADRMEWMTEKCVELGVDAITFIQCQNTERKVFKLDRIERIALSAVKQSQRSWMPVLNPLTSLTDFIQHQNETTEKFIAYVDPANPGHLIHTATPHQNYVILIGPEGDFTNDELILAETSGFKKVSLGKSRLRTETAGVAACHILTLVNTQ